jgi:hypothetical protein
MVCLLLRTMTNEEKTEINSSIEFCFKYDDSRYGVIRVKVKQIKHTSFCIIMYRISPRSPKP